MSMHTVSRVCKFIFACIALICCWNSMFSELYFRGEGVQDVLVVDVVSCRVVVVCLVVSVLSAFGTS